MAKYDKLVEISVEELKQIQLDILDYVDFFCRRNNIHYSISGGTLLGAVRHGGYIPWDDDIDIQLRRDEYNRFIEEWNKELHPYVFHNVESGNDCGFPYGKISDPTTKLVEGAFDRLGVNIDVFPVDGVMDAFDFHSRHEKILKLYNVRYYLNKRYNFFLLSLCAFCYSRIRYFKYLFINIPKSINNIAKSGSDSTNCDFLFEMVAGRICKNYFRKDIFDQFIDMKFEDRIYMSVKEFGDYLTATFGDYMKLPPEEKRVSHHNFKAYRIQPTGSYESTLDN